MQGPVEQLEPLGAQSIYHVCYEVPDLGAAIPALRGKKWLPLGKPVPAAAFGGRRIAFMLTPRRVELLETRR